LNACNQSGRRNEEGTVIEPENMMDMLAAGFPVTLLLDLVAPPDASEIYLTEGGDADWLHTLRCEVA
jgi:hypothetical protein